MSALIKLNDGRIEKHTLTLALAMVARKEAVLLDGSYHATVKARKKLAMVDQRKIDNTQQGQRDKR